MSTLEALSGICELPTGAIPLHGASVIVFYDANDGEEKYAVATHGETDLNNFIVALFRASLLLDREGS